MSLNMIAWQTTWLGHATIGHANNHSSIWGENWGGGEAGGMGVEKGMEIWPEIKATLLNWHVACVNPLKLFPYDDLVISHLPIASKKKKKNNHKLYVDPSST